MSKETLEWLNNNTLIGFTDKRGKAWHRDLSLVNGGLDNHYAGAIPADDIIRRLFAWDEELKDIYIDIDGFMMPVDGKKAVVRSDNGHVMGIHSDAYTPHSYRKWLVENLGKLVGGGAEFANAGLLAQGAQAWVQIEMPDNVEAAAGIVIRPFLLATTSFDGSIATTYKTGFTNTVCDNTFAMFMREAGETYRRKHTRNSEFELLSAASALNTLHAVADSVTSDIEKLLSVDVSDLHWQKFVEAAAPITPESKPRSITMAETKRQALTGLWRTDMRVAPWAGTAWGVVQAVNTYNEHMSIRRNVGEFERKMTRAVKGEIGTADLNTVGTLSTILGIDLLNA